LPKDILNASLMAVSLKLSPQIHHIFLEGERSEGEEEAPRRAGSLTWGWIPGPWDHAPSQRQTPNRPSHEGTPKNMNIFKQHRIVQRLSLILGN